MQCDICRDVLYICHTLGPGAVCSVRNLVHRVRNPDRSHWLHFCRPHLLSAFSWRLSMVVAIHLQCWVGVDLNILTRSSAMDLWITDLYEMTCTVWIINARKIMFPPKRDFLKKKETLRCVSLSGSEETRILLHC